MLTIHSIVLIRGSNDNAAEVQTVISHDANPSVCPSANRCKPPATTPPPSPSTPSIAQSPYNKQKQPPPSKEAYHATFRDSPIRRLGIDASAFCHRKLRPRFHQPRRGGPFYDITAIHWAPSALYRAGYVMGLIAQFVTAEWCTAMNVSRRSQGLEHDCGSVADDTADEACNPNNCGRG